MAPDGETLPLKDVAERVILWFNNNTELPREWDGMKIKTLVWNINVTVRLA